MAGAGKDDEDTKLITNLPNATLIQYRQKKDVMFVLDILGQVHCITILMPQDV